MNPWLPEGIAEQMRAEMAEHYLAVTHFCISNNNHIRCFLSRDWFDTKLKPKDFVRNITIKLLTQDFIPGEGHQTRSTPSRPEDPDHRLLLNLASLVTVKQPLANITIATFPEDEKYVRTMLDPVLRRLRCQWQVDSTAQYWGFL